MPNVKRDETGKFIKHIKVAKRICQNCNVEFEIRETKLKDGRGKCCSRKCVDENKKKTYKGELNPMYGKTATKETRDIMSIKIKEVWKDDSYRLKVKESMQKFFNRASTDGTWDRAKVKRINTMLEKYGKSHNWSGKYGERDCDIKCIELYGKPSHLIRNNSLYNYNHRTSIEIKTETILRDNNIENISQYFLDGYCYDFYLPKLNILIECDGDYWHGLGKTIDTMDDIQKNNLRNDNEKNKIANKHNIKLLRFWESEIKDDNFKNILLNIICQK
jgi:very-short-patch-repair endonuclease